MDCFEPKKLALLRVLEILETYSDSEHPLKQEDILNLLSKDFGIELERKTIGRNIALLKEAGQRVGGLGLCGFDFFAVRHGGQFPAELPPGI